MHSGTSKCKQMVLCRLICQRMVLGLPCLCFAMLISLERWVQTDIFRNTWNTWFFGYYICTNVIMTGLLLINDDFLWSIGGKILVFLLSKLICNAMGNPGYVPRAGQGTTEQRFINWWSEFMSEFCQLCCFCVDQAYIIDIFLLPCHSTNQMMGSLFLFYF